MISFYLSILDNDEDKKQFETLYIKYRQEMYAIAYSIIHNKEDSEDAVHQAFIKIANNFEKVRQIPCQEIKPYIVIIIRNTSINFYNSNKRKAEHSAELDDNQISVDVNLLENFEYKELVKKISELPLIYKDIIFLYYLEEFSTKEISKMLNISVDAVWKRTERAKKLLKESLESGMEYA